MDSFYLKDVISHCMVSLMCSRNLIEIGIWFLKRGFDGEEVQFNLEKDAAFIMTVHMYTMDMEDAVIYMNEDSPYNAHSSKT